MSLHESSHVNDGLQVVLHWNRERFGTFRNGKVPETRFGKPSKRLSALPALSWAQERSYGGPEVAVVHKQLYGPQCHIVCPSYSACGSSSQFTVPTVPETKRSGSRFEKVRRRFGATLVYSMLDTLFNRCKALSFDISIALKLSKLLLKTPPVVLLGTSPKNHWQNVHLKTNSR